MLISSKGYSCGQLWFSHHSAKRHALGAHFQQNQYRLGQIILDAQDDALKVEVESVSAHL